LIVVIVLIATFVPLCKQLIDECDTMERFYCIARSLKRTLEEMFAATNFTTKSIHEWTKWPSAISWLARGLADVRLCSLIFMMPACTRRKWLVPCASLLSNYSLSFS